MERGVKGCGEAAAEGSSEETIERSRCTASLLVNVDIVEKCKISRKKKRKSSWWLKRHQNFPSRKKMWARRRVKSRGLEEKLALLFRAFSGSVLGVLGERGRWSRWSPLAVLEGVLRGPEGS